MAVKLVGGIFALLIKGLPGGTFILLVNGKVGKEYSCTTIEKAICR